MRTILLFFVLILPCGFIDLSSGSGIPNGKKQEINELLQRSYNLQVNVFRRRQHQLGLYRNR